MGLIGWALMGYWVKSRTQELEQLNTEIQALNYELAQTANVREYKDKGNPVFWVEIDPTEQTGKQDGKTWARMPKMKK